MLTRLSFWLLDCAAEGGFPLRFLVDDDLDIIVNHDSHGASRPRLVAALSELFASGLIVADDERSLRASEIDVAFETETCFWLTPAGAAAWELAAQPDWDRYLVHSAYNDESDLGWLSEIIGAGPDLVERYFEYERSFCFGPELVVEESIARDVLRPWDATYWKRLAEGYRITFRTTVHGMEAPSRWDEEHCEFQGVPEYYLRPWPRRECE